MDRYTLHLWVPVILLYDYRVVYTVRAPTVDGIMVVAVHRASVHGITLF